MGGKEGRVAFSSHIEEFDGGTEEGMNKSWLAKFNSCETGLLTVPIPKVLMNHSKASHDACCHPESVSIGYLCDYGICRIVGLRVGVLFTCKVIIEIHSDSEWYGGSPPPPPPPPKLYPWVRESVELEITCH